MEGAIEDGREKRISPSSFLNMSETAPLLNNPNISSVGTAGSAHVIGWIVAYIWCFF